MNFIHKYEYTQKGNFGEIQIKEPLLQITIHASPADEVMI